MTKTIKHIRQVKIAGDVYTVIFKQVNERKYVVKVKGTNFNAVITPEMSAPGVQNKNYWMAVNHGNDATFFGRGPKAAYLAAIRGSFTKSVSVAYVRPAPKYKWVPIDRVRPEMLKLAARHAGYDEKGKRMMAFICGDDHSDETLAFARNLIAKKWTHVDVTDRQNVSLIHSIASAK